ncbi:MAG TPA: MlaE family lipid ABC transporter permease subunit [Phycisphaerales bacterium]|nr:MlaE family lipid ABC transporter permease subunit [Phycisphaerales bacterium]HMP35857.1 MlaE family lipid ABC transporter permease subunit [Phycisphaerales bacterium]
MPRTDLAPADALPNDTLAVRIEHAPGRTSIALAGRLSIDSVGPRWDEITSAVRRGTAESVVADGSAIRFCDGAGIGLLVEIDRLARKRGAAATFEGLPEDLRSLLDRALLEGSGESDEHAPGFVVQVGRAASQILGDLRQLIAFLGHLLMALGWALAHPHRIRWRDVLLTCEKAGANAVPVVCLLGFLMGLIISFQSAGQLQALGVESTIPMLMAFAMVRELGPLVTAIILAGRSGSAFAAELGTMKVTEELNALTTLGVDPVRFLVVPRLLAAMVMTPLLSIFATLFGLAGGYIIMASLGYGLPFYVNEVLRAVDWVDFAGGLFKAVVFAFLVAAVGCVRGFQTRSGPGAVGDSTTRAVVTGIVLIVVADGILGVTFFYLGV